MYRFGNFTVIYRETMTIDLKSKFTFNPRIKHQDDKRHCPSLSCHLSKARSDASCHDVSELTL